MSKCDRDTNDDGDCARCSKIGCPLLVFCPVMLDRAVMSDAEAAKFRANAEPFEYKEPWLGTIKGYRSKEGMVLIEKCSPT
jgi:hypothetical protein